MIEGPLVDGLDIAGPAVAIDAKAGRIENRRDIPRSLLLLLLVFVPLGVASLLQTLVVVMVSVNAPKGMTIAVLALVLCAIVVQLTERVAGAKELTRSIETFLPPMLFWIFTPVLLAIAAIVLNLLLGNNRFLSFSVHFGFVGFVAGVVAGSAWLVAVVILENRFGTLSAMKERMALVKPVFLVVVPVFITFGAINGAVSALTSFIIALTHVPLAQFPHELIFGGIEAVDCIVMVFAWCWFIRTWLGANWFWVVNMLLLHCVAAGYRTHRWELPSAADLALGNNNGYRSGPLITANFDWPDIIAPLLGAALFLLWHVAKTRRAAKNSGPQILALKEN